MSTITPRKNHVLVKDINLPKRTRGGLHLPLASVAHGGEIQSIRPYQLGLVISKGKMDKRLQDVPAMGSVVIYCNTAGKITDTEEGVVLTRFIHGDEILAEIPDYDPEQDAASFI